MFCIYICEKKWHEFVEIADSTNKHCNFCNKIIYNNPNGKNIHENKFCAKIENTLLSNKIIKNTIGLSISIGAILNIAESKAQTNEANKELYPSTDTVNWKNKFIIEGKITDNSNSEELPFANIIITDEADSIIASTYTDFEGKYQLELFNIDSVSLINFKCTFIGYNPIEIRNLKPNELSKQIRKIVLNKSLKQNETLYTVGVIIPEKPLIKDQTRPNEKTINRKEFRRRAK